MNKKEILYVLMTIVGFILLCASMNKCIVNPYQEDFNDSYEYFVTNEIHSEILFVQPKHHRTYINLSGQETPFYLNPVRRSEGEVSGSFSYFASPGDLVVKKKNSDYFYLIKENVKVRYQVIK